MNNQRNVFKRHRAVGLTMAAIGSLVAGGMTGCSGPAAPTDRAGGDTVVLQLASSDGEGVDPATYQGPAEFVEALGEVSGGRLKAEITWDYASGAADAETQLVEAIANGDVDGGWPATRAFARAGIEGLEAVEAPMVLTSEAAVEDLVSGDAADSALAQLNGSGITGLTLMAAPLRRPLSGDRPLVAREDWNGATFRVFNSPVQAAAVRALGARPVNIGPSFGEALRVGDLDGAEVDVVVKDLPTYIRNITSNVVLWPKVFVAAFNDEVFGDLTAQQQAWIREAAERATKASVDAPYDASVDLQPYCDRGTAVHEASPAQLAALRAAVAPVLEDLRRDPETADLMEAVDKLAAQHPNTDVPAPAGGCDGTDSSANGGMPTTDAPIADGTYRAEIPEEATVEVGNAEGWGGTWTLRVQDGTFAFACRPLDLPGTDCGHATTDDVLEAGLLKGDNATAWFIPDGKILSDLTGCELPPTVDDPDACLVLPPYSASWSQEGDELNFSDSSMYTLTLVPWRRVQE